MGLIAQVVERPARNWKDVGSSPPPARSFSDSMDAVSNEYHIYHFIPKVKLKVIILCIHKDGRLIKANAEM